MSKGWYDRRTRRVRDLSCGDARVFLELEVRRVNCRKCSKVVQEELEWIANNPFYTKLFMYHVGRQCRNAPIKVVASEHNLRWHTVKEPEKQYMQRQLEVAGLPAPRAIGIDEISIKKRHTYRIVVSDLDRKIPIWFGGTDRSEKSLDEFYAFLGVESSKNRTLAVMDMWKAFRKSTIQNAPQAAILFDKFHVLRHLSNALDKVRKAEYARLSGRDRKFIKGQKYTLLSNHENLSTDGRRNLKLLLAANKRLNTAYLLKESFGQMWSYSREGWARRFFENWKATLKWQRFRVPIRPFVNSVVTSYPQRRVRCGTLAAPSLPRHYG